MARLLRTAAEYLPSRHTLPVLRKAVQECRGCDLYAHATQAVFGQGASGATIMMVGEQPGNDEDLQGLPFVGPAGKLLDRALADAGIDRASLYITNAVKHFKFEERGKRRIHKTPNEGETRACRPWLEVELEVVKPKVLVCLGATAAKSIFGPEYRVTQQRGQFIEYGTVALATATIHPSAILRVREQADRHREYEAFVADLKSIEQASRKL